MQKETYKKDKPLFKRIPTKLFNDPIWDNQNFTKKEAYLDLFSLAYDADEGKPQRIDIRGYLVTIYPGEVAHGYRSLSQRWGWSTKKVGNFIRALEHYGYVTIKQKKPITVMKLRDYVPRLSTKGNKDNT